MRNDSFRRTSEATKQKELTSQNQNGSMKALIVVHDDLAERAKGWAFARPRLCFEEPERWHSPYINRFLSADTIVPGYTNPQSLNRYSYVVNNPLRYTDPSGHRCAEDGIEGSCTAVENKLTQKWKADLEEKRQKRRDEKRNWFQKFLRDEKTPMLMATVQEVAAGIGEAALIATVFQPEIAPVSAIVFAASWIVGRAASAAGTAATVMQYSENLNGTHQTDVIVSVGTTLAGVNPAWSFVSSTVNFLYTAERSSWTGW